MSKEPYDLIVIGAGPGGYVAAIRAAQLGQNVALVEERATLGGVCLNEGCIPSKALLDSSELFALARDKFAGHGIDIAPPKLNLAKMMARKTGVVKRLTLGVAALMKKNGIAVLQGRARLAAAEGETRRVEITGGPKDQPEQVQGRNVLLATGSRAAEIPGLPFDGQTVVSAREALAFEQVPEHLLVVGAGYIGLELGSVWRRLGARVTVVELLEEQQALPASDREGVAQLLRSLKKQGIDLHFGTRVTDLRVVDGKAQVSLEGAKAPAELACDRVLVAAGRAPQTDGLGLEEAGVTLDANGRVEVDEDYRSSAEGIYAIGDLVAGPMLAHKASEEAVAFAERLAGHSAAVEYAYLPGVVYTWPEMASVGKTEEQLKASDTPYTVGKFPFLASGRARCMDENEGFVKVLAAPESGRLLGVHILGPRASELIAEAVTAMTFEGSARDLALTFHAHPTLAEALKEAALAAGGEAIHA